MVLCHDFFPISDPTSVCLEDMPYALSMPTDCQLVGARRAAQQFRNDIKQNQFELETASQVAKVCET